MDYRETTVFGRQWRRAYHVTLWNPLGGTPGFAFHEQDVLSVGDAPPVLRDAGQLQGAFDPAGKIDLVNPDTGEPLGASVSYAEVYVALHSLYLQLAAERDSRVPEEPQAAPPGSQPEVSP